MARNNGGVHQSKFRYEVYIYKHNSAHVEVLTGLIYINTTIYIHVYIYICISAKSGFPNVSASKMHGRAPNCWFLAQEQTVTCSSPQNPQVGGGCIQVQPVV